ncbi:UNVERIFIED_CONTAM: hypothetical protein RMT77_001532 [Armadillidium vulgare]
MLKYLTLVFLTLFIPVKGYSSNETQYLPTVMWHGMGDSCCNPLSLGRIQKLIENRLPGIYVYSIQIGDSFLQDTEHGYIGSVNAQIQEACDKIAQDPLLQNGFNAVGFSQGSQFLRAVTERCPNPPTNNLIGLGAQHQGVYGVPSCDDGGTICNEARKEFSKVAYSTRGLVQRCPSSKVQNLISLGGQHQGVFGFPRCPGSASDSIICEYIRKMLNWGAYDAALQDHFVQAQYWHDPLHEETYRNYSKFIAEINNEREINEDYRNSLIALSNLVMVKFLQDSMVVPRESEWFGFYAPGQDEIVLPLRNTTLYQEDRLGLKILDEAGKLQFLTVDGDHLDFSDEWFVENIVDTYLSTEI